MRRAILLGLLAWAVPAFAQGPLDVPTPPANESPLAPELPTVKKNNRPEVRICTRSRFVYRPMQHQSINQGSPGRTNATRGELEKQRTGFQPPGLGGNPM